MNKRMATAWAVVIAGSAEAAVVMFTTPPGLPFDWTPYDSRFPFPTGQSFDPRLPASQGFNDTMFRQVYKYPEAWQQGRPIELQWTTVLIHSIAAQPVANVTALVMSNGEEYSYTGSTFTLYVPRSFRRGDVISSAAGYPGATAWAFGSQAMSRKYNVQTSPGVIESREIPSRMTIGLSVFETGLVQPGEHYAWADIEWEAFPSPGHWVVKRWAFETQAYTPIVVPAPTGCQGDANDDGKTDAADLSVLLSQFGSSVATWTGADVNGDGAVNAADLSVVLSGFGCQ